MLIPVTAQVRFPPGNPHREGDAREGRGRDGTDCAGSPHTPGCDARDGEGHTHWHARVERGENPHRSQSFLWSRRGAWGKP